jgi:hypothetical protein
MRYSASSKRRGVPGYPRASTALSALDTPASRASPQQQQHSREVLEWFPDRVSAETMRQGIQHTTDVVGSAVMHTSHAQTAAASAAARSIIVFEDGGSWNLRRAWRSERAQDRSFPREGLAHRRGARAWPFRTTSPSDFHRHIGGGCAGWCVGRDVPAVGLRQDGVVHEVVNAAERLRIHTLLLHPCTRHEPLSPEASTDSFSPAYGGRATDKNHRTGETMRCRL